MDRRGWKNTYPTAARCQHYRDSHDGTESAALLKDIKDTHINREVIYESNFQKIA